VPRRIAAVRPARRKSEVKKLKKAATITLVAGGLAVAGAGVASADSHACGAAVKSPGVGSGNLVQVPVHVPVNVSGNTVNVIGLLNPVFGNTAANQ
jgi:hypothetical protein